MRYRKLFEHENESLGAFLRELRKQENISQVWLADQLELPQSFISKVERGERPLSLVEFVLICQRIGVDPTNVLREFLKQHSSTFR